MQTVRELDTLWLYWVVASEETQEPIDLTATTIVATVEPINGGAQINIPVEIVGDPTLGRVRHKYDMLTPGDWYLTMLLDGPPGEGTTPTRRNAKIRVKPRL